MCINASIYIQLTVSKNLGIIAACFPVFLPSISSQIAHVSISSPLAGFAISHHSERVTYIAHTPSETYVETCPLARHHDTAKDNQWKEIL